jgi:hypothetical protein
MMDFAISWCNERCCNASSGPAIVDGTPKFVPSAPTLEFGARPNFGVSEKLEGLCITVELLCGSASYELSQTLHQYSPTVKIY